MGKGLSKRLIESSLQDLSRDFTEVSKEDREFVREELAWLAEWVRSRYPKLNFGEIRCFLTEMISVSV